MRNKRRIKINVMKNANNDKKNEKKNEKKMRRSSSKNILHQIAQYPLNIKLGCPISPRKNMKLQKIDMNW